MAVGLKTMGKPSPLKTLPPMVWMGIAQAGVSILGGMMGSKKRRREQRDANKAMQASRDAYMQQEYTNPYANLENPYEDLTVNQQQAQFQGQQQAQQRADILGGLRGTAGGAGVAGLAQAMANQSALGTQQISASIGQQEAMNQRLRAQGAAKVQQLEAYGEQATSLREQQRMETLYGMDMSRVTAANQARQKSKENMMKGIGQGLGTMAKGFEPQPLPPPQRAGSGIPDPTIGGLDLDFSPNLGYQPGQLGGVTQGGFNNPTLGGLSRWNPITGRFE